MTMTRMPSPLDLAHRHRVQYSRPTPEGVACGYCSFGPLENRTQIRHASVGAVRHCARVADYRAAMDNYLNANPSGDERDIA